MHLKFQPVPLRDQRSACFDLRFQLLIDLGQGLYLLHILVQLFTQMCKFLPADISLQLVLFGKFLLDLSILSSMFEHFFGQSLDNVLQTIILGSAAFQLLNLFLQFLQLLDISILLLLQLFVILHESIILLARDHNFEYLGLIRHPRIYYKLPTRHSCLSGCLCVISKSLRWVGEQAIIISVLMNSYSYLFKYIIIGDPSVGKSCILMQFLEGKFKLDCETTIGVEFGSKIVDVEDKKIKMQIWDTAGQEVFKSITRSYYRGSIGAILMYDITNRNSFSNLTRWIEETKNYANQKLVIILVGNKNDLDQKREVSQTEAAAFAETHRMIFMECSAKEHEVTQQIFFKLAREIIKKIEANEIDPKNEMLGVKLGSYRSKSDEAPRKWCC